MLLTSLVLMGDFFIWAFPVLVLFLAAQPYFDALQRIFINAFIWAFAYGVLGTMLYNGPLSDVPQRLIGNFLYMAIGMFALEWLAKLATRRPVTRGTRSRL